MEKERAKMSVRCIHRAYNELVYFGPLSQETLPTPPYFNINEIDDYMLGIYEHVATFCLSQKQNWW